MDETVFPISKDNLTLLLYQPSNDLRKSSLNRVRLKQHVVYTKKIIFSTLIIDL